MEYSLTDLCDLIMGQSPDSSSCNKNGNGIPFYQGNADFGEINPTPKNWCTEPKKIAKANDILISVRAPIGDLNIANEDCCIGRGVAALRIKNNKCNKDYLFLFLESKSTYLQDRGTGSTFKAINKGVLEELKVKCPKTERQTYIANEILDIKKAIKCKNKELLCLNEAIQSEFVEMFGENPVESRKWKVERLGNYGTFKNGMNYSPNENGIDVLCLNVSDFKDNYTIQDCNALSLISLNEEPSNEYYLQNDDIVFVRSNGNKKLVGRCIAVYPNSYKVLFSGFCIRFRRKSDELDTAFLLHFLKTDRAREQLKGKGANIQNLNQQILSQLQLPIPPLNLQTQFATFVQQIDKSKFVVKQQIADLQELLDSKMQEYFS